MDLVAQKLSLPVAFGLGLSLAVATGCRSKVETKVSRSPAPAIVAPAPAPQAVETPASPAPTGPVEVADGFVEERAWYQSRGTINLKVNSDFLGGDEFQLTNETSGKSLIERRDVPSSLRLYLTDMSMLDNFVYGENRLRLLVTQGGEEKVSYRKVELRDFPLQGLALSTFSDNVQVKDGYQVWIDGVDKSTVTSADGANLTTGFFRVVND